MISLFEIRAIPNHLCSCEEVHQINLLCFINYKPSYDSKLFKSAQTTLCFFDDKLWLIEYIMSIKMHKSVFSTRLECRTSIFQQSRTPVVWQDCNRATYTTCLECKRNRQNTSLSQKSLSLIAFQYFNIPDRNTVMLWVWVTSGILKIWPQRQPVRQCPQMLNPHQQLSQLYLQNGRPRQPLQTPRTMTSTMCGVSPTPGRFHTDPHPGPFTCSPSCQQSEDSSSVTIRELCLEQWFLLDR